MSLRPRTADQAVRGAGTLARPLRAALALLASLFALTTPALAGPPFHQPLPDPIGGFSLNHACGTAVDSEGDIYVSNAGEAKVEVFDPSGNHLKSIADANEPCGLAVDSNGNLYVSEKAVGKVVKYHPNEYPPTASITYTETTIDVSGSAKGISVDPTDDHLYVAEGTRIVTYSSEGIPGINEEQLIKIRDEGGTLTFSFEAGSPCAPIPTSVSHAQMEACLQEILGPGNFSLKEGPVAEGLRNRYLVEFKGALGGKDVPLLTADTSAMLGFKEVLITEPTKGWNGLIAEGELSGATGVAAYSYGPFEHYLSAAEPSQGKIEILRSSFDIRELEPRTSIDGSETLAGELGLAATGADLGVDPKTGHIFAYDAIHKVLNEFEASGHYFTQIANLAFEDAKPTAIGVDRSSGANDGTVYVTAGASAGAKLLAFGSVVAPSRASLEPLSHEFAKACGTAVDSQGDLYVAGENEIKVYGPAGNPIEVTDSEGHKGRIVADHPCDLAVDSEGNLYAALAGAPVSEGDEKVVLYEPSSYPFSGPPSYGAPKTIETLNQPRGIAVDPTDGHLFVVHSSGIREYDSAKEGSGVLDPNFCQAGFLGEAYGIDVYGATGDVYVVSGSSNRIMVCNADGTKVLTKIDGSGSPGGKFSTLIGERIAVDQANGHVLVGEMGTRGVVEEFDSSGAFIGQYGSFGPTSLNDLAIDNSGGPTDGNLYVAYDDPAPNTFDLTAFGPLAYGEPPVAVTGTASAVGGGNATLNGTVDPRGFELTACRFEYLTDAAYQSNGETFAGAESTTCDESLAVIGKGNGPVTVHAAINGLDPEGRYRFRLFVENEFGSSPGEPRLFGPPVITAKSAQPILYREATLRGEIDPSGLQTKYRFEYLTDAEYQSNGETFAGAQSTPIQTLSASSPPTEVDAFLTGLTEATTYRFRLLAENEVNEVNEVQTMPVEGPAFSTLERRSHPPCPNETLRLENNSSNLPDCRAYELVTPADTRGATPYARDAGGAPTFNNWLTTPSGPLAGESLAFFLEATLPGTEGTGLFDAFRASRGSAGWGGELFGPSFVQMGDNINQEGVSADQLYSFWHLGSATPGPGTLPLGNYLRTPGGFEALGEGSLDTDPKAEGMYISVGGTHVIFATKEPSAVQLELDAPSPPIGAVYDRSPVGPTRVVSLLPGEVTPSSSATYDGATPDGSAVVFTVAGRLYLRLDNTQTVEVAPAGSFSGISDAGEQVFYESSGNIWIFDAKENNNTKIAESAKFVNVSADGSHAYLTSEDDLTGAEENEAGEEAEAGKHNLYAWHGGETRFVAMLDATDLHQSGQLRFPGTDESDQVALDAWTAECVNPNAGAARGRAFCPSRSTTDGRFLVFQSHADLTPPYEGNGHSEIYRYDAVEGSLICASCNPTGAPATTEADLQSFMPPSTTWATTLIPGITDDGRRIFFQTTAALLPEDANSVLDVYEWQAPGTPECTRVAGCLALISSGQGERPSTIYSMTPDGHDVFFSTLDRVVGSDVTGSPSIYDARIEGGFPNPPAPEPCHGDACQGEGSSPLSQSAVRSDVPNSGNVKPAGCPKGKHRVKGRCVGAHHHKRHKRHHRRVNHKRGGNR